MKMLYQKQVEAEMLHYERLNVTGESPLSWWRSHEGQMPALAQFAQAALGVPGSSAALERLFSKAGLFITRRRPRLKPGRASDMLFGHANVQMLL